MTDKEKIKTIGELDYEFVRRIEDNKYEPDKLFCLLGQYRQALALLSKEPEQGKGSKLSAIAIMCPDENCCGCLTEKTVGEPECNECGRKYRIVERSKGPVEKPKIVCLCGSTRFMDAFFEAGWEFTLQGWIVLSVGVCKHADAEGGHGAEMLGQDVADRLDELHLRKIDLADLVYILNVGGYIGNSTQKEINYAKKLGKEIKYLE
jgi:hypothetical protein